jgi:adenosylhomocysteine nucleosidase
MIRVIAAAVLALAACHPGGPVGPVGPATRAPPTAPTGPVVVVISATAEWKSITAQLADAAVHDTPFGPWLRHRLGGQDAVVFHGGYGKVSAASSTQYAIDRWHPALLVNLGTCGGFGGERKVGDIVLARETIIYDIVERMGDPDEAIEDFHTRLDVARWPARLASRVVIGPIVSADGDLDPAALGALQAKYHASVGDWESGAIAWVASHNHTPVVILRGVTDLVDAVSGDSTYHAVEQWQRQTDAVMASLVSLLGEALPELAQPPAARPAEPAPRA